MFGKIGLFLVYVYCDDFEVDWCDFLQVEQDVEYGVVVFVVGQVDYDFVVIFDYVEVGDGFVGQVVQVFLQFVLID